MSKKLFIFEMANNHMGDLQHGKNIIDKLSRFIDDYPGFNFGMKFQFRDMATFIHPEYRDRLDIKYVKRFLETELTDEEFKELKQSAEDKGFTSICTGFDEKSVEKIADLGFSIIKIASCSFTDWPLLNRIAETDLPIIASTAGSTLEEIDNVVSFFLNRNKDLTLMHCVGEYPTEAKNLQLNQIKLLKERHKNIKIGYSTHEEPDSVDVIPIAIALGAEVFEKHVGYKELNAYSSTPEQVAKWLSSAFRAEVMCGEPNGRHESTNKEMSDLRTFKRGVFADRDIKIGETIRRKDVFYAFPNQEGQILANEMSKYTEYVAKTDISRLKPIQQRLVDTKNLRADILAMRNKVLELVSKSGITIPKNAPLEISHHHGIDDFYNTGLSMVTVVNEDYCKKLLISLPNQEHPTQWHREKTETFVVLYGEVTLYLDDKKTILTPGEVVTIRPNVRHRFIGGEKGSIIEEISTTHFIDDSYYEDSTIEENKSRKTFVTHWTE